MMWLLGAGTALAVLLIVPALPPALRAAAARRAAMLHQRELDRQRREQEAADRKRQAEQIWHDTPELGVMREWTRFQAQVRSLRQQAADEARRRQAQIDTAITRIESSFRAQRQPKTTYQVLCLFFLVVFVCVFGLGATLDYMIFRALHPGGLGALLLSLGLAAVAMIGITVGSILAFGAGHHDLLPDSMREYSRNVARLFGAMLAVGIAAYMAFIAPNRSELNWAPVIQKDHQAVQLATFNVATAPDSNTKQNFQAALDAAKTQLNTDQAALDRAKTVDRWSAIALGALEIPLAELAVLGSEVLILRILLARKERARRAEQRAVDGVAQADNQFMAQLITVLTGYGKDEATVQAGLAHVRQLGLILAPAGTGPGGATGPAGPGPQPGHGPSTPPGPGNPGPTPPGPGNPGPAAQPGGGAAGPAQGGAPTSPTPPGPTPPGPGNPGPAAQPGAAAAGPTQGGTPRNPVPSASSTQPPMQGVVIPPQTPPASPTNSNPGPTTIQGNVVVPSATITRLPQGELDEIA